MLPSLILFLAASDDAQSPKPQRSRSRQHRGFHRKSLSRSMSCDSHSKTSVSSSSRAHTVRLSLPWVVDFEIIWLESNNHFTVICVDDFICSFAFSRYSIIFGPHCFCSLYLYTFFWLVTMQKVDLSKLELTALWRYWRHFNLVSRAQIPR